MYFRKLSFLIVSILSLVSFSLFNVGCEEDDDTTCVDSLCIGVILPESGTDFPAMKAAIDVAASDINGAGGDVELIFRDSEGNPGAAYQVAGELLDIGVHGIVGAYASGVSLGIIYRVIGSEVVMVSPANTSPSLTEYNERFLARTGLDYPYYYRTTVSDSVHKTELIVDTIDEDTASLGTVDIALVYRDDDWGRRLSEEIERIIDSDDYFVGRNVVVSTLSYAPSADTESIITDISGITDSNTDVIVLLSFGEGRAILAEVVDRNDIPNGAEYYLGIGIDLDPEVITSINGAGGSIKSVQISGDLCRSESFEADLREVNPELDRFYYGFQAYDALVILALASLSAGSNEPTEYVSEMIKVSRGGTPCNTYGECARFLTDDDETNDNINYDGVSGAIEFDENGEATSTFYEIIEYANSGMIEINKVVEASTNAGNTQITKVTEDGC